MQNENIVITQVQIKFGWDDEETGKNESSTIWLSGEEALFWLQRHLTPVAADETCACEKSTIYPSIKLIDTCVRCGKTPRRLTNGK